MPQLGPPLPGDIGAGIYGGRTDRPIPDNTFRYQPPPAYDYAPVGNYGAPSPTTQPGQSPQTSKLFFIAKEGGGDSQQAETSASDLPGQQLNDPGLATLQTLLGDSGVLANAADVSEGVEAGIPVSQSVFPPAGTDIYNSHSLQHPISPFQVMAGTIIPASLVTGLNSDLPGQVIAQVTKNVFDTSTGQDLLIPQGTRLLGRYDSEIDTGQSRALVVWNRMIRPDGSSLVLDSLPGVDLSGQAGCATGLIVTGTVCSARPFCRRFCRSFRSWARMRRPPSRRRFAMAARAPSIKPDKRSSLRPCRAHPHCVSALAGGCVSSSIRTSSCNPMEADLPTNAQLSLRIGKLPDLTPVKLTTQVDPDAHEMLQDYARIYNESYGEDVAPAALIPSMLASFLASDHGFKRARKALTTDD
ncbi:MAG: TrbI/VirB10 family protein [Litorimonas sp.]